MSTNDPQPPESVAPDRWRLFLDDLFGALAREGSTIVAVSPAIANRLLDALAVHHAAADLLNACRARQALRVIQVAQHSDRIIVALAMLKKFGYVEGESFGEFVDQLTNQAVAKAVAVLSPSEGVDS